MYNCSGPLEEFLNFLRESERSYHIAEAEEQEAWAGVLDVYHDIELTEHTEAELLTLCLRQKDFLQRRRKAKDLLQSTAPLLAYIETHRKEIKDLEQLLGEIRKAERRTENRIYTPRGGSRKP